jgi:HlyD family secretion protein
MAVAECRCQTAVRAVWEEIPAQAVRVEIRRKNMKKLITIWKQADKKKKIITLSIAAVLLLVIVVVLIVCAVATEEEEVTYRETEVKYGTLSVGVTESGSVDIGTVEQTFDLDMSALQRASTGDSSSGSGGGGMQMSGEMGGNSGGLNMFDQIFNMAGSSTFSQSGSASSLTVSKVCVSVGQQISVGDVLYELEEESVSELTEQLESNVDKAKADLDAVYADQVLSKQTARYTYDSSVAYGSYAETEYNTQVSQLNAAVTEKEEQLEELQASLESYRQQLEETTVLYEDALQRYEECKWSVENTDQKTDTYNYVTYFQMMQSQKTILDSMEQKKERLEENVEQAEENVEQAKKSLNAAKRSLAQGLLSAKETLELRQLAYNTAQETYDIAIAYLEEDAAEQEETYAETEEKWAEYSSYVNGTSVCSDYNGVITAINLEEGDTINTGTVLVSLYDMDEVSMTVTVDEDDMTDIYLGSEATINLTAYPDTVFRAAVSEISDAETDSSGNVTYDVTVTITGDVSGLFQGMTGDITFISEETADVLYVSRRALITEGDNTYVKVRDEKGKVKKIQVTTGFTDGTYTEITGGLSEGDTVLIESKVN